ncbi:MAG: acetyl-CoA C-acyltransferase [Phycisphaerae bacterium]
MRERVSYVVAAKRSAIGQFLGSLSKLPATAIAAQVARALLEEARLAPAAVDEVIIGQVLQAGAGQAPARQVALGAGLPDTISAVTVNKVCGSGLQAAMIADTMIRAGDVDIVLTGGMESMSQAPYYSTQMRMGNKFGSAELVDGMLLDGLTNPFDGDIMGAIAEETASRAGVTREQQDEFALRSHQRAAQADRDGAFQAERVPIAAPKSDKPCDRDETIRADTSLEKLAALRPAFRKDGTITPGNASAISDGAAIVLVANERGVAKCHSQPLARIVAHATSGGKPRDLFFAPIDACKMVCEKAGWDRRKVDLWELNEAFASQMLACMKGLELDPATVNVDGGAIALGHPIGASGARLLCHMAHALRQRKLARGVVSLCLGGGNAVAMAVEAV